MRRSSWSSSVWLACLLIGASTLAVYWQVRTHEFNNFDSNVYVSDNEHVRHGFTGEGIAWAFTTFTTGNWHPLTWLSIMLDCELFGLDPGAHHLVSLAIHIASSLLLFLVLRAMTGAHWPAAWAAALFALHPLHVEPVAWAAQRKDVLSTLFLILTIGAYFKFASHPTRGRLLLALLAFVLGLLSKPMLVSVPILLLALDYWPLRRWPASPSEARSGLDRVTWRRLVLEKAPFVVLALASCIVAIVAQRSQGAVGSLAAYPLGTRCANAVVSCATYLWMTVWPAGLAVFYPYPSHIAAWEWIFASGLSIFATAEAWRLRARYPFLIVGWCWYLVSLLPVLGLLQVGRQARADRYTYVPHIGLFVALAWWGAAVAREHPRARSAIAGAALLAVAILSILSCRQVAVWRTSTTLYEHALSVTEENSVMHYNLAGTCFALGDFEGASSHYEEALRIDPTYPRANYSLAAVLARLGRFRESIPHYERELELDASDASSHNGLGGALYSLGDLNGALAHFEKAAELQPGNPQPLCNTAVVLIDLDRTAEARTLLERSLALDADYAPALSALARVMEKDGRLEEEEQLLLRLNRLAPQTSGLGERLAAVRKRLGR